MTPPIDEQPVRLPLQRRRVWRACEACRRKKIKCDGKEPVCSQCTQTTSTCNWIQTKDRAALSRHYVQELEARLVQMEGLLTQVGTTPSESVTSIDERPVTADLMPHATSALQRSASSPGPNRSTSYLTDPNVKQEAAEPDHFGQLAMDNNGHLRWIGGSSAMTLVDAFRNISNRNNRLSARPQPQRPPKTAAHNLYFPPTLRSDVRALPGPEQAEFPPRDLADKLVAAYFTHFHHTLPVVDSTAFLSQYRRLMDERRVSTSSETGFATVVFAVFACAARFVDDPRLVCKDPEKAEGGMAAVYYERAMILYYIGHTATQLAHVQAFVLLASFLASINSLPQSWLMCGQAVRIAQDLGLHRSPQHLLLTPIDKETRRKVWWCVYGLDRMLAVALGRPLGIDDADCDVELPLDIDDVGLPKYFASQALSSSGAPRPPLAPSEVHGTLSLMKGFNALTCLFKIAGQVLRSVYALDKCKENLETEKMAELQASVDRLDRLLTEWCDKLPAHFKSNPTTSQQVSLGAILCSCYYAVTVTLHRNFIPTSVASRQIHRSSSVAKAVTASRSCIFLAQSIKDVIPSSHWLAFFSQYLFSSAIIILLCIMHATDQNAVSTALNEVNTAIECLGSLESAWPGAKKCKDILRELADMTLARLQDGANESPTTRRNTLLNSERFVSDGTTIRSPGRNLGNSLNAASPSNFSQPQSPAISLTSGRKRNIEEVSDVDMARSSRSFMTAPSPVSIPQSPTSAFNASRKSLVAPSPLQFGSSHLRDDDLQDMPSASYAFSGSAASPAFAQPWSTPRSSSTSFPSERINLSGDMTMSSPLVNNPFAPFGTPAANSIPLDSAYMPSFAYAMPGNEIPQMQSPAQFDLSDLPFSGLDFLSNFSVQDAPTPVNAQLYEAPDGLWSQLTGSPFKMGPDLPFGMVEGQAS